MARVLTKKSTVAAKVPLATDLEIGELAVNTADAKLYTKHSDNTVKQLGIATNDSRLTDAREWTASTVSQAEAEAGTATTRRAWTAQRVFQAVAAWWAASADKTKLDGIQAGAQVNVGTNLAQGTRTTTAVPVTSSTGTGATLGAATTSLAGVMTAADKTKLDGVATGATANASDAQLRDRATHTGTQAISTIGGLQTALDAKLPSAQKGAASGVASLDANAKVPLAQLPDSIIGQVEYMGTWNAATNTPTLPTTPAEKGHYYVVSAAGSRFGHSFEVGDWCISNGASWDKVDNTDAVSSVNGRTGNVTGLAEATDPRLTDAREWTAATVTQAEAEQGTATTRRAWTAQRVFQAIAAWWAASAMKTKLDGIAAGATANATDAQLRDRATHTGSQAISTVAGLQTALDGKISTTERGVSGGVATLDQFARIPASQLPSYVDDVLEYASTANFPATGEGGKIYIAINQGTAANPTRQYRWTGTVYAEINPSPGTTDALTEGSTNLYFNESRVRNTVLTGLSLASSAAVEATDSVLAAFGKIQAKLNTLGSAAFSPVLSSEADTTPGALVRRGDFGVGGASSVADSVSLDSLPGGAYSSINTTLGAPEWGLTRYNVFSVQQSEAAAYGAQIIVGRFGGGRLGFRYKSGSWAAWQEVWHTGNFNPTTKADLASPPLSGTPTAPTPADGTNNTQIATTAFVQAAITSKQDKSVLITTATSRILALADAWNYLRPATTSAVTLTVPTNASVAFAVGTEITVRAAGNITLAAASGVTLNAPSGGTLNMTARMTVTLKKVGTNEWDVIGQTVPL